MAKGSTENNNKGLVGQPWRVVVLRLKGGVYLEVKNS